MFYIPILYMYEATYLASPLELSFADIGVHVVEDPSDI